MEADASAAREDSGTGMASILARLRFAENEAERDQLRAQLLSASAAQAEAETGNRKDSKG